MSPAPLNSAPPMRILIMGAGALGSVIGGLLSQAGHEVSLVGRPHHLNAIAQDGLMITGIWGRHQIQGLRLYAHPKHLPQESFDWIILAVKSYDTSRAMKELLPLVSAKTLVLAYQNGLGNAEVIARFVGWEKTVGARVIYGARILQAGQVEVTVIAQDTALGAYHQDTSIARIKNLAQAMDEAGAPTIYSPEIKALIWAKVAYNCALNPLSALLDATYGQLAEMAHSRTIMCEVVQELYQLAQAMEIRLDPPTAEDYLGIFFEKLLPPTAAHYASMREDFRRKRPTEIDALNGAILRYAQKCGLESPANAFLSRMVRAKEALYLPSSKR